MLSSHHSARCSLPPRSASPPPVGHPRPRICDTLPRTQDTPLQGTRRVGTARYLFNIHFKTHRQMDVVELGIAVILQPFDTPTSLAPRNYEYLQQAVRSYVLHIPTRLIRLLARLLFFPFPVWSLNCAIYIITASKGMSGNSIQRQSTVREIPKTHLRSINCFYSSPFAFLFLLSVFPPSLPLRPSPRNRE